MSMYVSQSLSWYSCWQDWLNVIKWHLLVLWQFTFLAQASRLPFWVCFAVWIMMSSNNKILGSSFTQRTPFLKDSLLKYEGTIENSAFIETVLLKCISIELYSSNQPAGFKQKPPSFVGQSPHQFFVSPPLGALLALPEAEEPGGRVLQLRDLRFIIAAFWSWKCWFLKVSMVTFLPNVVQLFAHDGEKTITQHCCTWFFEDWRSCHLLAIWLQFQWPFSWPQLGQNTQPTQPTKSSATDLKP